MKDHLTMMTKSLSMAKSLSLAIAIGAILTLSQGVARADEVTIAGSTTGTVTGVPQLSFFSNTFTGTTALGVGSLSGTNRLGTFFLTPDATQMLSGNFELDVTFTQPTGINDGQNRSYTATIFGSVSPVTDVGGVNIHFTNPIESFTFNDGTNSGTFTLSIADVFVQTNEFADLTAGISGGQQSNPVPEPATLLLLGTGLTGVAARLRKRNKVRKDG